MSASKDTPKFVEGTPGEGEMSTTFQTYCCKKLAVAWMWNHHSSRGQDYEIAHTTHKYNYGGTITFDAEVACTKAAHDQSGPGCMIRLSKDSLGKPVWDAPVNNNQSESVAFNEMYKAAQEGKWYPIMFRAYEGTYKKGGVTYKYRWDDRYEQHFKMLEGKKILDWWSAPNLQPFCMTNWPEGDKKR